MRVGTINDEDKWEEREEVRERIERERLNRIGEGSQTQNESAVRCVE